MPPLCTRIRDVWVNVRSVFEIGAIKLRKLRGRRKEEKKKRSVKFFFLPLIVTNTRNIRFVDGKISRGTFSRSTMIIRILDLLFFLKIELILILVWQLNTINRGEFKNDLSSGIILSGKII